MKEGKFSTVYPYCQIIENIENIFISDYSIPKQYKTLNPLNPSNTTYSLATKKLFKQLELSDQELWICQQHSFLPIRVYFTQPKKYMISACCRKCFYLQFEYNLSGKVICSGCEKICFCFVHTSNKTEDVCEKIFKNRNESILAKKQQVRKLISAEKHRQKKLNHIFKTSERESKKINIGEFVIQMKEYPDIQHLLEEKQNDKTSQCTKIQQQIKEIIIEIFS